MTTSMELARTARRQDTAPRPLVPWPAGRRPRAEDEHERQRLEHGPQDPQDGLLVLHAHVAFGEGQDGVPEGPQFPQGLAQTRPRAALDDEFDPSLSRKRRNLPRSCLGPVGHWPESAAAGRVRAEYPE